MEGNSNKDRISEIIDAVMKVARGDHSAQVELSGKNDDLDSVAMSLNMMFDDIRKNYQELQAVHKGSLNLMKDLEIQGKELDALNKQLRQEIAERKQAEDRIQQQNEFLNSVLESLTYPFYVINANNYTIKMANSVAIQGKLPETSTCYALTHGRNEPCKSAEHPCPLEAVKKTKKPIILEHIHYDKEGNARNIEMRAYPIFNGDGDVIQIIEYALDITERKQAEEELTKYRDHLEELVQERTVELKTEIGERKVAEEALRESERRYRLLAENVTDVIWTVDMDLRYTYISPSVTCLHGHSVEEAMALTIEEILTPASLEVAMRTLAEELAMENTGLKDLHRSRSLEFEQYHKDGHTVWTETIMTFLRDPDGQPVGILGVTRDITERKRAEEGLRESEERYRDLFENANDLIQSVDGDGNFVYVNRKWLEIMGYSNEELKKLNLTDILRKDQIPHCMEIFNKVCSGKSFDKVETVFIAKDGREITVEGNINAYFKDGRFVSTRGIFRDITERKKAEDKLEQTVAKLAHSNAELEHFAYIASHDLQEPLRMVSSYVQLLERRYKGKLDEDADEFIAFAVDGASRMRALINGLLTYSRVDTRGKPFEPTDSETIFKQATDNLKVAIEESGAVITHDPLPTVMADDLQLSQLLQNLIGNGIKFSSERQPQINVSAEKKENEWFFSIRDNGIGIDPKNQERIFQIFHRLHSRSEYQGTGIGLAVCKKIVERHGGRIWVESGLGKGSTFYFTITNTGGDQK